MRLVFRADASMNIGSGHVMRCLAIAEEASSRGIPSVLVGSLRGVDWLQEHVTTLGIDLVPVSDFILLENSDYLIIDSYEIPTIDNFISRHGWHSVTSISDEHTPTYKADLIIHPGLDGSWYKGNQEIFLSGPRFIPFRKSITKRIGRDIRKVKKIVVFGGGTDTYGFAQEISGLLSHIPGFEIATFFSQEKKYFEELDPRFRVHPFGRLLDGELSDADLVFTTASTSSLEIVAREIPLGVACAVENQNPYYHALGESKVAVQIGNRVKTGRWEMNSEVIQRLISDHSKREELLTASSGFVDLNGAKRIVDAIIRT